MKSGISGLQLRWDDFQLLLCVGRAGSFAGAAGRLRVSTPTVFRHARNLEERLGTLLFHRDTSGVTLTAAGEHALVVAQRMEGEIADLEARIANQNSRAAGTVRLATVDTLTAGPLLPVFLTLKRSHPALVIDVRVGIAMANLRAREADAALRAGGDPPETLVGRKLCRIHVAVYRAAQMFENEALEDAPWVTPDEDLAHLASSRWLTKRGYTSRSVMRVNSLHTLSCAVASGVGLGILPCYVADADPRLVRASDILPELASDLWFLTHPELRGTTRIRALSDHLAHEFGKLRPLFEGKKVVAGTP